MSVVIADSIEDTDDDDLEDIQVAKVTGAILEKVVAYCTHYQEAPMDKIETPLTGNTIEEVVKPEWYATFVNEIEQEKLYELVAAANFLNIKSLLDLTCFAVSVEVKGKSVESMRNIFHLPGNAAAAGGGDNNGD